MAGVLTGVVDLDRHPIHDLTDPRTRALLADCRSGLRDAGVAIVADFLRLDAVASMCAEADRLAPGAHHQDLCGTPYLELPADGWPAGHPRLTEGRSALTAIAYDEFASDSPLRRLYEWNALTEFLRAALDVPALYRYDDPLGGLNVAAMHDGDELFWHFDQTDFVVSIALQSSDRGGDFECVAGLRTADDERYEEVAEVLAGSAADRIVTLPMRPGALMLFAGRHSLHQVTRIEGDTPRYVALLGYDTRPGTCSSELLRLVRYGRAEARA